MTCEQIIEELMILNEDKRTKDTSQAIGEAINIIDDWRQEHSQE